MPGRITELSESQIIADLRAEEKRLLRGLAAAQMPMWTHDRFVAPATYQLTYVPYGINFLSKDGSILSEGTDYTVNYGTGLVSLTVTPSSGDVIAVDYVTTGDLVALSGTADTGGAVYRAQATRLHTNSAATSFTLTLDAATHSGDSIALAVITMGTISTVSGCGATWTRQTSHAISGGGTGELWTGLGATAGLTTVTVATSSSVVSDAIAIAVGGTGAVVASGYSGGSTPNGSYFPGVPLTATDSGQGVVGFLFVNGAPALATFADTNGTFTEEVNSNSPTTWFSTTESASFGVTAGAGSSHRDALNTTGTARDSDGFAVIFG